MRSHPISSIMRVCYLIQTHKDPNQIHRLVHTIKKSSPDALIIISHDFTNCDLKQTLFEDLTNVKILASRGGRGNFAIVQSYLDAIAWLLESNHEFDWFINLSGQDYPIQPIAEIEAFLSSTNYDAFIHYFDVFSDESPWKKRAGYTRYCYKYRTLTSPLPDWQQDLLKPAKFLNYIQPFFRVNFAYGFTLGLRTRAPFTTEFGCYGGSFLSTLSRKCVEYIDNFVRTNSTVINHYKTVEIPDESLIQTILVNSQKFNLCNDCKRYFDFSQTHNGHPRTLGVDDFPRLKHSQAHFARKFDLNKDSKVLDLIDLALL
jgi:hypothetical protein